MSSSLLVPIVQLENVRAHTNADSLELCDVLGYQMVIPKGKYKNGDVCVYFPADTLLPAELGDSLGVRNYLRGPDKDRVGRVRLRGEPSFGLLSSVPGDAGFEVGDNAADYFGCKKYIPPIKVTAGDAIAYDSEVDPFIERYTDIENGRLFTDVFAEGEDVIVTEKIHGTNTKIGFVKTSTGIQYVAGSMSLRRKPPKDQDGECYEKNTYWFPLSLEGVASLLRKLEDLDVKSVILYGEVYGGSIQSLSYGLQKGHGVGFRAFDLMLDGKYLDFDKFISLCETHSVPVVPVLFRGEFSIAKIKELAEGDSTIPGAKHIKEGVVVKPVIERIDVKIGRAVLKYISTSYDFSKYKDEDTTDC